MTRDTERLIGHFFAPDDRAEAAALIERDCGRNLPFCENHDDQQLERLRFAAIRYSEGNLERLVNGIYEAQKDWRDLLMMTGFAHDVMAHRGWAEAVLEG